VIYLLAKALSTMTGWNTYQVIFGVGAATIFYTLIGGIEAVVWTDVAQGFLFVSAGLACLLILLFRPAGGPGAVLSFAVQNHKTGFGPYEFNFAQLTFWVMAINGIFYALQKYTTDQTIVQRYLLSKDDRTAIRASLMGVLLCAPTWALFMFIGTCLWAFYHLGGYTLPDKIKGDDVFPYFITTQLPMGITGLVLAGLLAAAMSSLASDLNCLSAVGVEDYYRRLRPGATDRQRLRVGKSIVAVCGILALLVACAYARLGETSILATVFALYAIFSGGLVGLFALGFFTRRANARGALVGIAACILFTLWAVLTSSVKIGAEKRMLLNLGRFNFRQHAYMVGVWSHVVLIGVGYLASLFLSSDQEGVTQEDPRVRSTSDAASAEISK
jgi:SSS family solute:Na+ symporter